MMTAFGSMGGAEGMSSDLENMLQMVQADATEALRTQSANAIGRLHQVCVYPSEPFLSVSAQHRAVVSELHVLLFCF